MTNDYFRNQLTALKSHQHAASGEWINKRRGVANRE
jgi:hypothetical protein